MLAPTLSILVATWNCSGQLAEFLASLAEQTYADWELLLLDNAFSDGTAELVQRHQQAFPEQRILWSSQSDPGIYDAWNRGLALAPSAACWTLNWAKYGRRKLIGLA